MRKEAYYVQSNVLPTMCLFSSHFYMSSVMKEGKIIFLVTYFSMWEHAKYFFYLYISHQEVEFASY